MCCDDGGKFAVVGCEDHDKWWEVDEEGQIVNCKDGDFFILSPQSLKSEWIYMPPEKTAFQEWESEQPKYFHHDNSDDILMARKEGWNASNDRITSDPQICLTPREAEKIKALKEP
jgi:hypothetical protein